MLWPVSFATSGINLWISVPAQIEKLCSITQRKGCNKSRLHDEQHMDKAMGSIFNRM